LIFNGETDRSLFHTLIKDAPWSTPFPKGLPPPDALDWVWESREREARAGAEVVKSGKSEHIPSKSLNAYHSGTFGPEDPDTRRYWLARLGLFGPYNENSNNGMAMIQLLPLIKPT
jgi:hypothetical protein